MTTSSPPSSRRTQVYYDGLCHLCYREIEHYRKVPGQENLEFIDITAPGFSAEAHGVDPVRVHKEMHVRRPDGKLAIGVEAFASIWDVLPRYRFAAKCARQPFVLPFLKAGYWAFAHIRPYLPKRKVESCAASPYCEIPKDSNPPSKK